MINKIQLAFFLMIVFIAMAFPIFGQPANVYNYRVLSQIVNDLTYSDKRKLIYASVPSTGGQYGNFVIAINPFSKQIVNSVFVGSEPNKIAISDDEQFLYVGLDGSASVRKVNLETFTADISFGLGSGSSGFFFPEDIAVLPNQPNSVAVSRRNTCCSPRHEGVAVFDNGIMRQTVTPGHTGSNSIEAGENETVLYGYNNESTDFGFRKMSLSTGGISIISNLRNVIQGFNVDIRYSNGRIYSTTGVAINAANNSLDGTFAVSGFMSGVEPDADKNRVFYIQGSTLTAFNAFNFQPAGSTTLPDSANSVSRLMRWGRRGLAYRNSNRQIVIFETALVPVQPNTSDFNGDEKADFAVFRPSGGLWFSNTGIYGFRFGNSTDIPVAADYDGDNVTDFAVFRDGLWYIFNSSNQTAAIMSFGISNDKPVPADFDGDHKTDLAVYRNGIWWVQNSLTNQVSVINFGIPADTPVPADFDGDGKTDYAVYRAGEGNWYILTNSTNQFSIRQFGINVGKPVPADYDGDGKADLAVWQNSFGTPVYYILQSRDNQVKEILLDNNDQSRPFPADFDGDGQFDAAVFAPSGIWTLQHSKTAQVAAIQFGTNGDRPILTK